MRRKISHGQRFDCRTIFLLRYYEGYTAKEIAELLHLPAGTVRSRLSRCRKYLKEQL